jgi:hypothetical protein
MRFSMCERLVVAGVAAVVLSGCGTCPNLCYKGPIKDEDMVFIRERVAEKNVDLHDEQAPPSPLAMNMVFVPLYLSARGIAAYKGPESVTHSINTGGTYSYGDMDFIGFPLTLWLDMVAESYSESGEELSHACSKGLVAGLLGSWGDFRFESRKRVASSVGANNIITGGGIIQGAYPSRWYFTGTEGHYWNAPLFLFGHVSSNTSGTFHILGGLIPIRYYNSEKPGNR